jgi:hypothetical protein
MVVAVILAAGAEAVLAAEVVLVAAEAGVEAVPASNSHHLLPLTSYFLPLTSHLLPLLILP